MSSWACVKIEKALIVRIRGKGWTLCVLLLAHAKKAAP